jgi:hypothetical protein
MPGGDLHPARSAVHQRRIQAGQGVSHAALQPGDEFGRVSGLA